LEPLEDPLDEEEVVESEWDGGLGRRGATARELVELEAGTGSSEALLVGDALSRSGVAGAVGVDVGRGLDCREPDRCWAGDVSVDRPAPWTLGVGGAGTLVGVAVLAGETWVWTPASWCQAPVMPAGRSTAATASTPSTAAANPIATDRHAGPETCRLRVRGVKRAGRRCG
jgi:hypothetical protein